MIQPTWRRKFAEPYQWATCLIHSSHKKKREGMEEASSGHADLSWPCLAREKRRAESSVFCPILHEEGSPLASLSGIMKSIGPWHVVTEHGFKATSSLALLDESLERAGADKGFLEGRSPLVRVFGPLVLMTEGWGCEEKPSCLEQGVHSSDASRPRGLWWGQKALRGSQCLAPSERVLMLLWMHWVLLLAVYKINHIQTAERKVTLIRCQKFKELKQAQCPKKPPLKAFSLALKLLKGNVKVNALNHWDRESSPSSTVYKLVYRLVGLL